MQTHKLYSDFMIRCLNLIHNNVPNNRININTIYLLNEKIIAKIAKENPTRAHSYSAANGN